MVVGVEDRPTNQKLNKYFWWYKNTFENILHNSIKNFLETEIYFKLVSISKKPNDTTKNDSFFVSQIKLTEEITSYIKLSQYTVDKFLEIALGNSINGFCIENITELEGKILTELNHNLYKDISQIFISQNKIKELKEDNELQNEYFFLTFMIKENSKTLKIIIKLPSQILQLPTPVDNPIVTLKEEYFAKCLTNVDILVGKTKTHIEDIKNLQIEDLVILEHSDITKMKLIGDFEFEFNLNPDPMLVYNYQENSEYEIEEDDMPKNDKNKWDLIQVDMSAEFEKVKMPLGEIRQISEGLIVDLADIYKNNITLKVEDNAIAKGELVIIDDKYGVLIKEILTEDSDTPPNNEQPNEENDYQEQNSEHSDDFDLEDFDIDDDIDNLDDEDI